MQNNCWVVALWTLAAAAVVVAEVRRAGWLDRVVQYHKHKFFSDFSQLAPVNIEASIEPVPEGYVDSPGWDFESVARLLALIKMSETAGPVRRSLRRMLAPSPSRRRFTNRFSYKESLQHFPSIADKYALDNMYLDYSQEGRGMSSEVDYQEVLDNSTAVLMVRNPVEARLPSARISVQLLKDILESRAIAGRKMPPPKLVCPEDQYVDPCVEAYCDPVNCSQLGFHDTPNSFIGKCPNVTSSSPECNQGCICKEEGLVREAGVCVRKNQCPSCRGDPNARPGNGFECTKCGAGLSVFCWSTMRLMINGCQCKAGFLYHEDLKRCVPPEQCPDGGVAAPTTEAGGDASTEPTTPAGAPDGPTTTANEPGTNVTDPSAGTNTTDPNAGTNTTNPDPATNGTAPQF